MAPSLVPGQDKIQRHGLKMISSVAVFPQLRFWGHMRQNHLGNNNVGACVSL